MKILILAIVLCVAEGQARANYGRQSHSIYKRQEDNTITGEQTIFFIIKTLEKLQSLFAAHNWDNLYAEPGLSLQLPNQQQDRVRQKWKTFAAKNGRPRFSAPMRSRRNEPPKRPGLPPNRPTFPPPPPPPPPGPSRSRPRRSDALFREHDPKPSTVRPPPPSTTTPRR